MALDHIARFRESSVREPANSNIGLLLLLIMGSFLRQIQSRWLKWTERALRIPMRTDVLVERLGSTYGGWIIPANLLNTNSICYLVGAGEDVSFDLALADRYGCPVHVFDPTPRAVAHVELLKKNLLSGQPTACATAQGGYYPDYPPALAELIHLHPVGIWHEDAVLRFYAPQNEAHVSHSLVNLQRSEHAVEVPVRQLSGVMAEHGHKRISLLKLDIEGAEYQVLTSLLVFNIEADALCIEYDENHLNHLDRHYLSRIEASLMALHEAGYRVIAKEPDCHNYTLLHSRHL
jgi:Methyltransferase FkbM domain